MVLPLIVWSVPVNTKVLVPWVKVSLFAQFPSRKMVFPNGDRVPPVIVMVDEAFSWSLS